MGMGIGTGRQIDFYMDKETQDRFLEYCAEFGSLYARVNNGIKQITDAPYGTDPETTLVVDKRYSYMASVPLTRIVDTEKALVIDKSERLPIDTPLNSLNRDGHPWLYLHNGQSGDLITREIGNGIEIIDIHPSPVIEIKCAYTYVEIDIDSVRKTTRGGDIYIKTGYYNESYERIKKPKEFINLYNRLARWIKKNVPYKCEYNSYICDNMFALVHEGFFRVAHARFFELV